MTEVLRLVSHPLAVRMSFALLHFLWQGAALAGLALLLLAALRRAPAGARYLALLAVFALMALCPAATFLLLGRAPAAPPPVAALPAPVSAVLPAARPITDQAPPAAAPILPPAAARPAPPAIPAPRPRLADLSARLRPALPWMSVLWLAGVVALSLRLLLRWWVLRQVGRALRPAPPQWQEVAAALSRRLRMSRPVRLMVSAAAGVPMVLGWLRPVIVLPASALTGLTSDQLTALLAHELAHLRRHDQWVNVLQTMIELLLFYHPAVWWLSRALRAEREHCCDDIAVALSGDAPSYIRALAWVDEHREAPLRPALAASGSPLLRRIRRLAGLPAPAELRHAWLAAALSLAMAAALPLTGAISRAAVADSEGHRPGLRDQWQPQTEHDARLAQPVHIEILGRAAVPALEMLSRETGVSLSVAPESLETVGERKLTVIAQGCSLKSIMVQIPNALQECHWDVDVQSGRPAYLLHRNAGAEATKAQLAADQSYRYAYREENRPVREARVALARRALTMTPAELAELEKTDLYLARSVQDPKSRSMLELFLSLPQEQMNEFLESGVAAMPYPSAPEHFRTFVDRMLQDARQEWAGKPGLSAKILDTVQGDLAHATIQYEDDGSGGSWFRVFAFEKSGSRDSWGAWPALWSQFPRFPPPDIWYRPLLLGSGTADEKAADALEQQWEQKSEAEHTRQRDEKRAREWIEPRNPALHKVVKLPSEGPIAPIEVQRLIARETGLSLVSDYFTERKPYPVPDEARESMPAWRLLYLLGEHWFWTYTWNDLGDCLVFHDRCWYRKPPEVPESLAEHYREKLARQGRFTLDDVVAAAVALANRPGFGSADPSQWPQWPYDIARRGMDPSPRPALLLYATLSPEQQAALRAGKDLPYAEMTPVQQQLVRQAAKDSEERWRERWEGERAKPALSEDEIMAAVYRMKQSREELPGQEGDLLDAGPAERIELQVVFPSRTQTGWVMLLLPKVPAQPAPPE
jgi:beta-lactamase regulating signal transducer with metallopeptidase domain